MRAKFGCELIGSQHLSTYDWTGVTLVSGSMDLAAQSANAEMASAADDELDDDA